MKEVMLDKAPAHGGVRQYSSPQNIIDFSSNLNPYGPPAGILQIADDKQKLFSAVRDYPDPEYNELRAAIGSFYGRASDEIVACNGIADGIYHLIAFLKVCRGINRVVLFEPTFSEYRRSAEAFDLDVETVKLSARSGFRPDIALLNEVSFTDAAVFICDPNNPTGVSAGKEFMSRLREKVKKDKGYLVADLSFKDPRETPDPTSEVAAGSFVNIAAEQYKIDGRIFELRSLTKLFGIAGLRVGAIFAEPNNASEMRAMLPPWSIGGLNEAMAICCLSDRNFVADSAKKIKRDKLRLLAALKMFSDIEVLDSETNYFLIKILKNGLTAPNLQRQLLEAGFLIRDCSNFIGLNEHYYRIAVLRADNNDRLLEAMKKVIA